MPLTVAHIKKPTDDKVKALAAQFVANYWKRQAEKKKKAKQ